METVRKKASVALLSAISRGDYRRKICYEYRTTEDQNMTLLDSLYNRFDRRSYMENSNKPNY
jgi:hypothetical protein